MPLFKYKAVTAEGRVTEGTLEAADQKAALAKIQEQGQLPIKVISSEDKGFFSSEFTLPWKRKRVRRADLLIFTQELATLSGAGLPLDRSLTILSGLTENEYLREIVKDLLRDIKGGKSLSDAMEMYPHVFPKLYVSMVKAGEAGGALDLILIRLIEYLEEAEELRNYFTSSMIYPAILGCVSSASIIVMVTFVIPKFADIFENAGAPIPLPMRIMLAVSGGIVGYWWAILLVIIGSVLLVKRHLNTETGRQQLDSALLRMPLIGTLMTQIEVSRFSRTLGTLLRSAVPMLQSINIVREVVGNTVISGALDSVIAGVKKGDGLAKPLQETKVFPDFSIHLLQVGEETGRLDEMLIKVAEAYDKNVRNSVKRLVALFEPLIILFMGLVIGLMVVSMLYSIFSINNVPL
ncbi:MAG: type II secretion system F family protein [Acidobacteriota bacterium]